MNCLQVIIEGVVTVGAEAAAPIGIGVMRNAIMVGMVIVGGMMREMLIMIVEIGGIGVQALVIEEAEVVAHEEGRIEVQLEKGVKRGVLKLSSGTEKKNNKKIIIMLILMATKIAMKKVTMVMYSMKIRPVAISSSSSSSRSLLSKAMVTDLSYLNLGTTTEVSA